MALTYRIAYGVSGSQRRGSGRTGSWGTRSLALGAVGLVTNGARGVATWSSGLERKPYQQYSREFKLEAIRLAEVGDKTASQVARELDIRVNQLFKWRKQLAAEKAASAPVKRGRPADGELERLPNSSPRARPAARTTSHG